MSHTKVQITKSGSQNLQDDKKGTWFSRYRTLSCPDSSNKPEHGGLIDPPNEHVMNQPNDMAIQECFDI